MPPIVCLAAVCALVVLSASCGSQPVPLPTRALSPSAVSQASSATPSPSIATLPQPTSPLEPACKPTRPNGSTPPGEAASPLNHGENGLWTVLWPHGTVIVPLENVDAAGVLWMKFPWWRGPGVEGRLRVSGREVSTGTAIRPDVSDAYGSTGFQATGIGFPTAGCYEISAVAQRARLMIVTRVRLEDG
jgi:hypothetical protein